MRVRLDGPVTDLAELAGAYGVDATYWDWRGEQRHVGEDTLRAVLAAFDVDASSPQACRAALDAVRARESARVLPPCVVLRSGRRGGPTLPAGAAVSVELEDGSRRELPAGGALPTDLPLGYHTLVATMAGEEHRAPLVVAPDGLPLLPVFAERPRWGLTTQLYSVRSGGSWGVGDLADLRAMAGWAAREHGADFVLVNPVHAGEVVAPLNPSPYLPTSRLFANPIYLRVEDLPEYATLDAADRAAVDRIGAQARRNRTQRIERDPAWAAKLAALTIVHAAGLPAGRAAAFEQFRQRQGVPLERFATWCALSEAHGGDWRAWPQPLRDPAGDAVREFAAAHATRVDFFAHLQWWLAEQLAGVQAAARADGMALGIVHDVAVGVSPSGADAWAWQEAMATSVQVGAPPDAYSQLGQDWQQPPWRPDRLAATGYAPLREMFGNVLRYGGGLRVDHIIGLFRLWWIPVGSAPLDGTYVHYEPDAMLGVLALEAHRAGAVVVGEDLGNVEPTAQAALRDWGLLGTSILWFETDGDAPLPPQRWREYCLASVTTHDLPPTAGYLAGDHIRLRAELGLLTRSVEDELAVGDAAQSAWFATLEQLGLLAPGERGTEPVVLALHRYLLRTPSVLRGVALTDAVGDRRTQNQPGTTDEYPNWRVPLSGPDGTPMLLEDVYDDPRVTRLLAAMTERDD